jgi:hypothetical protein
MVILISGKKRAGKDYIADIISKEFGFKKIAFANNLKEIISVTFNISLDELDLFKNEPQNFPIYFGDKKTDFRKILQRCGTAIKPIFGEDIWANLVKKRIEDLNSNVVISDFRFLSEYYTLEDLNPLTIKVINRDLKDIDNHISENELNDFNFDIILDNTSHKLTKDKIITTLKDKL